MPTITDFLTRLETFLGQKPHSNVHVARLPPLAGGASRDTWGIDVHIAAGPEAGKHQYVLRRDQGGTIADDALSREDEFRLLEIVHQAGVAVPRPRWVCTDPAVLGAPFLIMDRLEGESVGRRVVRDAALADARQTTASTGRTARQDSRGWPVAGSGLSAAARRRQIAGFVRRGTRRRAAVAARRTTPSLGVGVTLAAKERSGLSGNRAGAWRLSRG